MKEINTRKAGVIGCGFVGAASSFALAQSGVFSELVLLDADRRRAQGEALDISHGLPFLSPMKIYAGDYRDLADAAVVIIAAGAAQGPGETRLELVQKNTAVFRSILPQLTAVNRSAVVLIATQPVDVLTSAAVSISGLPAHQIFGAGTVLDTARLKYLVGQYLAVDPRSVHAFVIGEHGDSEIAAWSSAHVSGIPLARFCQMRGRLDHQAALEQLAGQVRSCAYEIIARKQASYFGLAASVRRICEAIVRDEKAVLPVSCLQQGMFGIRDIALSLPAVVGKNGVEAQVPISLNDEEIQRLRHSAATLQTVLRMGMEA